MVYDIIYLLVVSDERKAMQLKRFPYGNMFEPKQVIYHTSPHEGLNAIYVVDGSISIGLGKRVMLLFCGWDLACHLLDDHDVEETGREYVAGEIAFKLINGRNPEIVAISLASDGVTIPVRPKSTHRPGMLRI